MTPHSPRDFIQIRFQEGPVPRVGVNGCRVEDVIEVLIEQLEQYQEGPLECVENAHALIALRKAKQQMVLRRERREQQGVLNTHQQHESFDSDFAVDRDPLASSTSS